MTDKDNIIQFPKKRADNFLEQWRQSLIAKGKGMFGGPTPQRKETK